MDSNRVAQRGQAPGPKISCGSSRIERAAPNILWCPLVERRLRRMGDVLGALNYLGGQASQEELAWILGCTTRTIRTGAGRALELGLLERTPCSVSSLRFSPDGRSWWKNVPKVPVRREEYLKLTPAQVRALEVGLHGLCSGQRGVAKRGRISPRTVARAFDRLGVHIQPGYWVFRGVSSGRKVWWKRLRSYSYLPGTVVLALLGSFGSAKTPSTHPTSPGEATSPRTAHADRANPPPEGRTSPTAAPLPLRTWRPYGPGRGTNSGISQAAGALSWL